MAKRFVSIWFSHLTTNWFAIRQPALADVPFVLTRLERGRKIITAANTYAEVQGVQTGMAAADARAVIHGLEILDEKPGLDIALLKALAEWCIRYTPVAAIDPPCGLLLNVSGCCHLWGGEAPYLNDLVTRLKGKGYHVRAAMADTPGTAWAVARYGKTTAIVNSGAQLQALLPLPPAALRLEPILVEKLQKLGLYTIAGFINMPRSTLRRRFGQTILTQLDKALGIAEELIDPVQPAAAYQERLPCLEPLVTATAIEIALQRLLAALCQRLKAEGKGLRSATFKGLRADGKTVQISTGTNRPTHNVQHLFKLFEINISTIEPGPGIELFTLEALVVEDMPAIQEAMWGSTGGLDDTGVAELLDRIAGKFGQQVIKRYLPEEHHWPERSFRQTASLQEQPATHWPHDKPRPLTLLASPQPVEVTAPVPDYPPMMFRYKGILHKIVRADGPERIEREWWLDEGPHRDYYYVEDEAGQRYWLFRSGHYEAGNQQWFIHGFFA